MKPRFFASIIAAFILVQAVVAPASALSPQSENVGLNFSEDVSGYSIEYVNLNGRASDTLTIKGNTIVVVTSPYSLTKGEHLGIAFDMKKNYNYVDVAIGRQSDSLIFISPTVTSSGFFVKTYTYEVLIEAATAGDYYIAIRNSGPDSISITNVKIIKG